MSIRILMTVAKSVGQIWLDMFWTGNTLEKSSHKVEQSLRPETDKVDW